MSTRVEKSTKVDVPLHRAYDQWTQFEEFPRFMEGVERITQVDDDRLDWVAEIRGVRRRWEARITEQVPDRKVAWAATEGTTNAGAVTFEALDGGQTSVTLVLDYEPDGIVERAGELLGVVERQAEADLGRFKAFVESQGDDTEAGRGSIGTRGAVGTRATAASAAGGIRMLSDEEIERGALSSPQLAAPEERPSSDEPRP